MSETEQISENTSDVSNVPKPIEIEKPQIISQRKSQHVSALSLKSIQRKQEIKNHLETNKRPEKDLPKDTFTEEDMLKAWEAYAIRVQKKGGQILFSHLNMSSPSLNDNCIQVTYPNYTIKTEMEQAKHGLLNFIRKELNNYDIDLEVFVNELEEKKYVYSDRDKFEKLKEKNPLIDRLRIELDLDIK